MTELERLVDESRSSRTRALLRAGRAETSPDGLTEHLLASVGVAAAASALSSAAAASLSAGSHLGGAVSGAAVGSAGASSLAFVAKWVVVGVLGGGMLAAGLDFALSPPFEPVRAPLPVSAPARPAVAVPRAALPITGMAPTPTVSTPPALAGSSPRRAPGGPTSAVPAPSATELGREVELIERARRALSTGNPSLALSELDAYRRIASTGVLDREARVLRIRALRESGDEASARELSNQYVLDFPDDAHAQRLKVEPAERGDDAP